MCAGAADADDGDGAGTDAAAAADDIDAFDAFDAIIFPEHSAILAVGATQKKAVVVEDCVEICPVANVTLSVDHRLINGRNAAEFLTRVKDVMESGEIN